MPSTYTPIATTTLGSGSAGVTFSSIPSTYTDLILVSVALRDGGGGGDPVKAQFNSDTGNNYSFTQVYGNGSSAASGAASNNNYAFAGVAGDTSGTAWVSNIFQVMNYANTTTNKTTLNRNNDLGSYVGATVSTWRSTSAISSIYLFTTSGFKSGSTFTLYGVKNA
jgi:hypothetical protein